MHGEYARKSGQDVDDPDYRQEMWEFHYDLHETVRPIDYPEMVPHIHHVSQRGKGARFVRGDKT
jgi:hypothetical protein